MTLRHENINILPTNIACKQEFKVQPENSSMTKNESSSTIENYTSEEMECSQNKKRGHERTVVQNETAPNKQKNNNFRKIQSGREMSVGYPDGLAMDPLSPTALNVSAEFMDRLGSGLSLLREHGKKVQKYVWKNRRFDIFKKSWNYVVTVVLIEARSLPEELVSGSINVYCKFRLGKENYKSKMVSKSIRPIWRERFNMYLYDENCLEVTVWQKAKQKNFIGRCVIDLSHLEKERTHDLWQRLECGSTDFGAEVHLLLTVSGTSRAAGRDTFLSTVNGVHQLPDLQEKYAWYKLNNDWGEVGQLTITVHGAKGLTAMGISGKADAFCVLELDNARLRTHAVHGTSDPQWDKTYTFEVRDVTSTLDISVYDEALLNNMKGETLGKLTIPLLRINNGEKRWYALKDKSKKRNARGNCPKILLEMSLTWNPVKASLRVFSPKENKYIQKSPKFDIPLIYSNLVFIKNIFQSIYEANESLKQLFEWENRQRSAAALAAWLVFWLVFKIWMAPLLLLPPFLFYWSTTRSCKYNFVVAIDSQHEDDDEDDQTPQKDEKTIRTRLYGLQDLTLTIKNGIDYIISIIERLNNLCNFTVPYLSYLAIIGLIAMSLALYLMPINYLFMALGLYKFIRKYLKPDRVPNNDIMDFISRVPDNEILKEWRELKVRDSGLQRTGSIRKFRN